MKRLIPFLIFLGFCNGWVHGQYALKSPTAISVIDNRNLMMQAVPPAYQLFTMISGVPTAVTSTLTTGAVANPPAILAKCVNAGVIVDCNFSGGSGTFNALTGDATSTATGGATTVLRINGGTFPTSASLIGSNGSAQPVAATGDAIITPLNCLDSSGSGTVQTCTTSPTFSPAAGDCIVYRTTTSNTGAGLTLNVNSQGAKSVAKWLGTTTLVAGDVNSGSPQIACYNGVVWNLSTIGNAPAGGSTPTGTGFVHVTSGTQDGAAVAETGTGSVVRATSPTLVTPNLGTPSAIDLTNATFPASVVCAPGAYASLTDGATVTWAVGNSMCANAKLTFTTHGGSRTLNLTGLVNGGSYVLEIIQDPTGGEGLILGSGCGAGWRVSGNGGSIIFPSVAASAIDVLAFTYNGTICLLNFSKMFS